MARLPGARPAGPSTRMLVTDGVHSCQCSTSRMIAQTRSGGAWISTWMEKSRAAICFYDDGPPAKVAGFLRRALTSDQFERLEKQPADRAGGDAEPAEYRGGGARGGEFRVRAAAGCE